MGPSWGSLEALLGAFGMFLGPPDRYDEDMCWLIDLYGDFGLSLGGSSEPLGASWEPLGRLLGLLGASWELLGGLLGSSWGAFVGHQRVQHPSCCIIYRVLKKCLFLEREHKNRAPAGLLAASCRPLGASWESLGGSWDPLGASWKRLGAVLGAMLAPWRPLKRKC